MSNTTETFWDVDGVSLQTHAFNITTLGEDREAPPPVRGSSIRVPYMPGTLWTPGVEDERVISLGMWVVGTNEDGSIPTDEDARRTYDRNWRALRKLLYRPRKQFTLTKRFWVETQDLIDAGVDTAPLTKQGAWSLYTASAKASYFDGLSPRRSGQARGVFTVDLLLNDPFFYSEAIEILFSVAPADEANPGPTQDVSVLGDARTTSIEFEVVGPMTTARMTNLSEPQDLYVQYGSVVAADERAIVRVQDFGANHYPIGEPFKSSGYVQHGGDKFWFYLEPGDTQLQLSAQSGTGTAKLRYQPVWL